MQCPLIGEKKMADKIWLIQVCYVIDNYQGQLNYAWAIDPDLGAFLSLEAALKKVEELGEGRYQVVPVRVVG